MSKIGILGDCYMKFYSNYCPSVDLLLWWNTLALRRLLRLKLIAFAGGAVVLALELFQLLLHLSLCQGSSQQVRVDRLVRHFLVEICGVVHHLLRDFVLLQLLWVPLLHFVVLLLMKLVIHSLSVDWIGLLIVVVPCI